MSEASGPWIGQSPDLLLPKVKLVLLDSSCNAKAKYCAGFLGGTETY